jgi:DNA-binding CsgD family transcriptional regulator
LELVERAFQLHTLESALSEVQVGEGCVALVYGEAGIGKTSLVEHFTKGKEKSWRILSGACDLLFTPRPLGPLGDIALQTQGRLLSLLDAGGERGLLFSACLSELKSQPTILVIEDIHWADEATLDLLKYLGRRMRQTACLMILTYRDDEIGDGSALQLLLGDLASSHCIHRVPVSALTLEAVRELVRGRTLDPAALHRLTSGNPFFLTEVLAGDGSMPQSVRDAMLARSARLSLAARQALEAASVAGLRLEAWLLAEIAGADCAGIEECISRGMLQSQGDGYAFRHELARQAILERVPVNRKRELNRRALTALSDCPQTRDDLARLASHAEGTGDGDAVLEYAPAAARQAATAGAHRQAAALYQLALRYADSLPAAQHAQMLEAYSEELRFLGRPDVSIPVLRETVERYRVLGDHKREGVNVALLALELNDAGCIAESVEAIQAAVLMLERYPPSDELARAYRSQCHLLLAQLDFVGAVAAGEKAIALAEQFGDLETVARACDYAGLALLCMEDARGIVLMERSLAVGRKHGLAYAVGGTFVNWAWALVETFRFEDAALLLQEGIAYTTQYDDDHHLGGLLTTKAHMQVSQGQWAEAADLLGRVLARSRQQETTSRLEAMIILAGLRVRRGDVGPEETPERALVLITESNMLDLEDAIRAALAEAAWLRGDQQQSIKQARIAYDRIAEQHLPWMLGPLAFWRWRAGDVFTPPEWIAKPYALQIAGDWRGAAEEWETRGCPYEQAMALMDGDQAAQLAALDIFERLGAQPILEKLKRNMRANGVRGIPRGPRTATRGNQFGLTVREMEILSCLVNGSSNNAIARELSLSTRTVEHHIASMLQKTDTRSRGELVALAAKESSPSAGQVPPASP